MTTLKKPLHTQTAADVMSRDLVVIPQEMSLQTAAHLLTRSQISGAPVVDGEGRCVGVISSSDFVRWADCHKNAPALSKSGSACVCAWEIHDVEALPADQVKHYMTPDAVMVPPAVSIGDLARRMLDAHIHRIIVIDEKRRPIGVVSSTDLLGTLAGEFERPSRAAPPLQPAGGV